VKAFLLAAGLGTRLRPLTDRVPKCLVPLAGRPMLDYWLELLQAHSFTEVLVNLHHLPSAVEEYLSRQRYAVRIRTVHENTLLGSAGTVAANHDWVDGEDAFGVIYADNLSTINLTRMADEHRRSPAWLTMALYRSPTPEQCGIAEMDSTGRIVSFVEKPGRPATDLANAGVYLVSRQALGWLRTLWEERQASAVSGGGDAAFDFGRDVFPRLPGPMRGFLLDGYHLDIGTWENYLRAQQDIAAGGLKRIS
jgi:mannose-1-phosphate guanylyltransferase